MENHPRPDILSNKRNAEDDLMTQINHSKKLKLSDDRSDNSSSVCGQRLEMKQELFDYQLLKYIIYSLKPYNTVDEPTFREMIGGKRIYDNYIFFFNLINSIES